MIKLVSPKPKRKPILSPFMNTLFNKYSGKIFYKNIKKYY